MELALWIFGILVSFAIAAWQHRRATEAEAALAKIFEDLPKRLVADLSRLIGQDAAGEHPSESSLNTQYADLNGDGKPELLVSFLSGPHNTALQVFGMKSHWEFGLLGEIYASTPTEFDLEDVDGDGTMEVSIIEIAKGPDLPYVMGLRDRVSYKLTKDGFVEVKRVKGYSIDDLQRVLSSWHGSTGG